MSSEPESTGVLVQLLRDHFTGPGSALWHLAGAQHALTLCGLDVGYGTPRLPWADTPDDRRCWMCIAQLGGRNRPRR